MRFLHLADLHFGKRLNEKSLMEDQRYVVEQILSITKTQAVEVVLIAGDVYDKNIPTVEAVQLLDCLLSGLSAQHIPVCIVSGNHDSSERLEFGRQLFEHNAIFISGLYQGKLEKKEFKDCFGAVNVYFLPFIKATHVNAFYPGSTNAQEAVAEVLSREEIDLTKRNILIAHQFVTARGAEPIRSDSEQIVAGNLDNVEASLFEAFDYVALGHIHRPQRIGRDTIRYAGSPLKYSFSEANHQKSALLVEVLEKERVLTEQIPFLPLHDLRELKGPIDAILDERNYNQGNVEDYMHITLTDEEELYDAVGRVRTIYPNLLRLEFENSRTRQERTKSTQASELSQKTPYQLFEEFYKKVWDDTLAFSKEQEELITKLLQEGES